MVKGRQCFRLSSQLQCCRDKSQKCYASLCPIALTITFHLDNEVSPGEYVIHKGKQIWKEAFAVTHVFKGLFCSSKKSPILEERWGTSGDKPLASDYCSVVPLPPPTTATPSPPSTHQHRPITITTIFYCWQLQRWTGAVNTTTETGEWRNHNESSSGSWGITLPWALGALEGQGWLGAPGSLGQSEDEDDWE